MSNPEKRYHHIRVKPPDYFHEASFRVIDIGDDIKMTIGCPKKDPYVAGRCKDGTEAQKLLFPKDKYTVKEAKAWLKKHPRLKGKRKKAKK